MQRLNTFFPNSRNSFELEHMMQHLIPCPISSQELKAIQFLINYMLNKKGTQLKTHRNTVPRTK
jgi:hypothetical protein